MHSEKRWQVICTSLQPNIVNMEQLQLVLQNFGVASDDFSALQGAAEKMPNMFTSIVPFIKTLVLQSTQLFTANVPTLVQKTCKKLIF